MIDGNSDIKDLIMKDGIDLIGKGLIGDSNSLINSGNGLIDLI